MNIFILDNDLDLCAEYHIDAHSGKMQLEAAHEQEGEEPVEFAAVVEEQDVEKARVDNRAAELQKWGINPGVAKFAASLNLNK